ncbi:MAG: AAA family ATPase [Planctomycetota bacterium]
MSSTTNVSEENVLPDFRQRLADILNVNPLKDRDNWGTPTTNTPPETYRVPLSRDQELGQRRASLAPGTAASSRTAPQDKFLPMAPRSLAEAGLTESAVEALVLKYLLQARTASGTEIAQQLMLPFKVLEKLLGQMKQHQLLVYTSISSLHDYVHELTELGRTLGHRCAEQCTYFGAAPVSLADYATAVAAQSIHHLKAKPADVSKAFSDLTLSDAMLQRVGRAVCSGKGLFLYGAPGNGKTCIAERITKAYGLSIWIPRALNAFGEIIRLYDPSIHVAIPMSEGSNPMESDKLDQRWVRIERPTIVVGGELTLDSLEIRFESKTGIGEAPLQLKSNCGTLVVDDFGRQRVAPAELLNRWIVPLEKHYDYLTMASGRKIQVPFDQFVIFSTNLEPRDLVDEAFLRRIPYKIDVSDPSEDQFRKLFAASAAKIGVACASEDLDYLIEHCYRTTGRAMRFCHARDLLHQIEIYYDYLGEPPRLSREAIEASASNYFSMV